MNWIIKIDDKCKKELKKLQIQSRNLIKRYLYNRILKLEHPKQAGKALRSRLKGLWRYRVDKFRIICRIEEEQLVILVIEIGKRDEVYDDD